VGAVGVAERLGLEAFDDVGDQARVGQFARTLKALIGGSIMFLELVAVLATISLAAGFHPTDVAAVHLAALERRG
jgi:hypothetical protein